MKNYFPPINDEEKLICKKAQDLARTALARRKACYSQFLDERGIQLAVAAVNKIQGIGYVLYGGYSNAERQVLCVFDENEPILQNDSFPICSIKVICKGASGLSHRDFLGSLMALGIKREFTGDILVSNGENANIFLLNSIKVTIKNDLITVGKFNCTVNDDVIFEDDIQNETVYEEKSSSISSLRLDCVLAALLNKSRGTAVDIIKSKSVKVCHMPVDDVHFEINEGDTLSIKGYGKFIVSQVGGKTKKDRIYITYKNINS
ncbi:MAG: YlmH/Sll1252 family protein [Oscillospiraceae bacterium]